MLAEPISLALSKQLGGEEAKRLVKEVCQLAHEQNRHLAAVVRDKLAALDETARTELGEVAVSLDWQALSDESNYLGASEALIDQILTYTHE